LDPALIRPGRVDTRQYIGFATEYQISKMFINFYPEANVTQADEFSKQLLSKHKNVSAAQIQGYFMHFKNQPTQALNNIEHFHDTTKIVKV
jgi:mitochondrial chaperone BCS1